MYSNECRIKLNTECVTLNTKLKKKIEPKSSK